MDDSTGCSCADDDDAAPRVAARPRPMRLHHGPDLRRARRRSRSRWRSGTRSRSSASIRRWSIAAWTSARRSRRRAERAAVPHHLVDICDPRRSRIPRGGSRAMRCALIDADPRARARAAAGRRHDAVLPRVDATGWRRCREADPAVRAAIDARARDAAAGRRCTQELARVDPEAARAHPSERRAAHPARARSATHSLGGASPSCRHRPQPAPVTLRARLRWCRVTARELYARIEQRFDAMLAAGFVDEVRALRARGDLHARPAQHARRRLSPAVGASRRRL